MKEKDGEKSTLPVPLRISLALAVLAIGWILLYRGNDAAPAGSAVPRETQTYETSEPQLSTPSEVPPVESPIPVQEDREGEQSPAATAEEAVPVIYDAKSYQLVTDMVYAYKMQLADRDRIIAGDLAALKEHDARLGEAWSGIMEYWDYANTRMVLNYDRLPEDLPQDDSLCIVVLGFQLEPDGAMSPEMHGRCQLALRAAEQYPNAYLAVTGGGTAYLNPEATEAGVMAEWFLRKGIPEERLILEDKSSTTEENALFTRAILTEGYPQIKSLVIVSSDYHLPLGCLMFTEAALLYGCEHGKPPFAVVSNLALSGYGIYEYKNPEEQGLYVWRLADPQLKK